MGRSLLAVGGGFVAMLIIVMVGTIAATMAFMPGGLSGAMAPPSADIPLPGSYLMGNLLASLIGAAAGGWIAARLAPHAPGTHVMTLAFIVFALGAASALTGPGPGQPSWYPWTVTAIGVVGVTLGGALGRRTAER